MKLGVRYYLDPAIRGMDGDLGDAAEVMFTRGLARAGEVGQSGFIPERDLPLLARRRRYEGVVRVLTESGLWQAVPGGYQVRRWADWQDHLDALARKRTADRERQRARRAAAQNGSTSEDRHPPNASRDMSRDIRAVEREGEISGTGRGIPHGGWAAGPDPPPDRCPEHASAPADGPCGPCGDARRARQAWEQDRAWEASAERSALARQRAELRQAEIAACDQCNERGYLPNGHLCRHDPNQATAARRGAAAAREALNRARSSENGADDAA